MTDFSGTSLGLEYEFPKLRIVNGGEPKTVLFSSSTASDMRGVKLVLVTVDIATGNDATTEVITGPIVADPSNPKWEAMLQYLHDLHRGVTECEQEGKRATTARVVRRMEGKEDEREATELDELGGAVAQVLEKVPPAITATPVVAPCPVGMPPPPPPPPMAPAPVATRRPARRPDKPEAEQPRFDPSERWFVSVPQINLGIQIATVGDSRFETYKLLCQNLGGRISETYQGICAHLDPYVDTLVTPETSLHARLELKGVLTLNLLIASLLATWNTKSLDLLDNKKVPYKESWGVLPKVKPSELWQAIDGDSIVSEPDYWRSVARNRPSVSTSSSVGEAERMVDMVMPGNDRRPQVLELVQQLGDKIAGRKPWKPAPGAPRPFRVCGKTASLWELRASAADVRKATLARAGDATGFGMFEEPDAARRYFEFCAGLAQGHLPAEELVNLAGAANRVHAATPAMAPAPPPPPPPAPPAAAARAVPRGGRFGR